MIVACAHKIRLAVFDLRRRARHRIVCRAEIWRRPNGDSAVENDRHGAVRDNLYFPEGLLRGINTALPARLAGELNGFDV